MVWQKKKKSTFSKKTFNGRCSYSPALLKSVLLSTQPLRYEVTWRAAFAYMFASFYFNEIKNPRKFDRMFKTHTTGSGNADSDFWGEHLKLPTHFYPRQRFPHPKQGKRCFPQTPWTSPALQMEIPIKFPPKPICKTFLQLNQIYKSSLKIIIAIIMANIPCSCYVPSCMLRFFYTRIFI